ncbi:MAG: ABC transporter ATP-binding protein [Lachnospiraceae bacterium]|nr:ABC transporter ATP-binding protein [Lachnospiraceae bacterium]
MSTILKVKDVRKVYGAGDNQTLAVDGISFAASEGEFVGIMGASGSGKTTLLNCISTIDTVTDGSIFVGAEDITKINKTKLTSFRREKLGFIFQQFNLLDTLTAYENIALALSINHVSPKEIDSRVRDIAEKLDIVKVLEKYPYEMSGGQQQRVAAARAMVSKPSLILADEPTGALDSKSAKMLLSSLEKMNESLNATILMVTHDSFSASYCKRILFIRDGRIYKELFRGNKDRKAFLEDIIEVVSQIGGSE